LVDKYKIATSLLIPMVGLDRRYKYYGSCFCCFHTNENSEAGHLYKDPDGVERQYCHVCKRQFTSADYLSENKGIDNFKEYLLNKGFTEDVIEEAYKKLYNSKHEELVVPEFTSGEEFFKQIYLGEYYNVNPST